VTPWLVLGAALSAVIGVERAPAAFDCPDAERLTAKVEAIVGRSLSSSEDSSRIFVQVQFSQSEAGYQAHLRLTGAREGERVLRDNGQRCEALADAVAVTVALLFDPGAESPATHVSVPLEPTRPALGWWLGGRFGLGLGLVGGATWIAGGTVGISLGRRTWFELGAGTSGVRTHAFGAGSVRVRLGSAELSGFHSLTRGEFQLGPALSLLGGVTSGTGDGYATSSHASLAYIALGGGARAQFRVAERVLLSLRAEAVVPLQKQVFSVGYVGDAYLSSALSARADLGLAFEIW